MKIISADVSMCCPGRNFVNVKVTTDEGIYGLGDATLNGRELAVTSYLGDHVAPCIMGRDPFETEDIWQYLYRGASWRRCPVTTAAIGVVDKALWDHEDGFYYDVLRMPDGTAHRLKVRSMVGLLPLCAATVIEPWQRERVPRANEVLHERLKRMPELRDSIHPAGPEHRGHGGRGLAALVIALAVHKALAAPPALTIATNTLFALFIWALLLHLLWTHHHGGNA